MLHQLLTFLSEAIFPTACVGCQTLGAWCCGACEARISIQPRAVADRIFAATSYRDPLLDRVLLTWKYQSVQALTPLLGSLLDRSVHALFDQLPENPLLIPVPLHRSRERQRGFYHTLALAEVLGQKFGWAVEPRLLLKTRATKAQAKCGASERRINVAGSFSVASIPPVSQPLLLIDDVITTGSTLAACQDALEKAGYKDIFALVIAAVPLEKNKVES